jgi:prepilin-type N-terminal cleavage/methylation domain-containing protein
MTIQARGQTALVSRPAEQGFTLIELLIAMSVTVIGLMGLLSVQLTSVRGNQVAGYLDEATVIGQRTIEELRSTPLDQLEATFGPLPIDHAVLDTADGRTGITYNRSLSVDELTAASPDLVRIRIEITFTEAGAVPGSEGGRFDHQLVFELVRTRQEAL